MSDDMWIDGWPSDEQQKEIEKQRANIAKEAVEAYKAELREEIKEEAKLNRISSGPDDDFKEGFNQAVEVFAGAVIALLEKGKK